jgi:uncharacterized protein
VYPTGRSVNDDAVAPPATQGLDPEEQRVLGCLFEKQMTTPDQYPLTLNALSLACNQKSNRDPVVNYDERTVLSAVTSAKTKGLVRFVHPSHGRSVVRYAHTMVEALGLSDRQLALVAVLMLRGPQTPGELRARTERMAEFDDLEDLERELARLCVLDPPVAERLARQPGQSQDRYVHLLGASVPAGHRGYGAETAGAGEYTEGAHAEGAHTEGAHTGPALEVAHPSAPPRHGLFGSDDSEALRADIASLRLDLAELRSRLSELEGELADIRSDLGIS